MKLKEAIDNSALFTTFKTINNHFLYVFFLDYLYYMIFLFVGSFYVYKILPSFLHILDVAELLKEGQAYATLGELISGITAIQEQWFSFQIGTVVFFLFLLLNYCIFKYVIWKKIQNKNALFKQDAKSVGAFALLSVSVLLGALLVLLISWYTFTLRYFNFMFFFVVPFAAIYANNLLHPLYVQQLSIKKTYTIFWNVGVKKCYKFMIPYLIMLIGIVFVIKIIPVFLFLPDALYFLVYVLAFVTYFSWTKYYLFVLLQKQIQKQSGKQK